MNWRVEWAGMYCESRCHMHPTMTWYLLRAEAGTALLWPSAAYIQPLAGICCEPAPRLPTTYNGPTRIGRIMSPHKSLLTWAQSATDGYTVEFHPSDGTDRSMIFTEWCEWVRRGYTCLDKELRQFLQIPFLYFVVDVGDTKPCHIAICPAHQEKPHL
jgi:hypothetical protein